MNYFLPVSNISSICHCIFYLLSVFQHVLGKTLLVLPSSQKSFNDVLNVIELVLGLVTEIAFKELNAVIESRKWQYFCSLNPTALKNDVMTFEYKLTISFTKRTSLSLYLICLLSSTASFIGYAPFTIFQEKYH